MPIYGELYLVPEEQGRVQPGQPLGLHRQEEKEEELQVGVQGGKGEKHGEVNVVHTGPAGDQPHKNVEHDAGEVKKGEFTAAPFPLQGGADEIGKVEGKGQQERPPGYPGNENKGEKPPDLTLEDQLPGKKKVLGYPGIAKYVKKIDQQGSHYHIEHEPGDAEPGVLIGEPVQPGVDASQSHSSLSMEVLSYCSPFSRASL